MKHLDLFSGIGGFALAASRVWGNEHEIVSFCEIDRFCQKILRKNFPNVPIHEDIKTLHAPFGAVDLVTGGFPCQPFSLAGQRRGSEDDRYLWHEMFRVITEARPRWIIGENVAGIVGMALDGVLSDLESEGYSTEAIVIPACALNAPHRRDRVWIIANTESERCEHRAPNKALPFGAKRETRYEFESSYPVSSNVTNSNGTSAEKTLQAGWKIVGKLPGLETSTNSVGKRRSKRDDEPEESSSNLGWTLTESPLCGRNHGIPHRVDRVRALGNAIVPQVAEQILTKIKILIEAEE